MYSVVLLMAITSGGEVAEARGCRGCGCAVVSCGCYAGCGCARPARGHKARHCRGCGCYVSCGGCYTGCAVSYSGCAVATYSAPVTYGCAVAAPVTYGCAVAAPVTYGCAVAAPVVSTGCAVAAPVSCAGGHLISSAATVTSSVSVAQSSEPLPAGAVLLSSRVIETPASGTAVAAATKPAQNSQVTTEDDKLTPGSTLSAQEQTWLKEMLTSEQDQNEKKKLEDEFKKDSRVGRKATYEVFKKMKSGKDQI